MLPSFSNLHSESQETLSPLPMDLAESLRGCIRSGATGGRFARHLHQGGAGDPSRSLRSRIISRMLFDNLLTNAVHYSHDGGAVEVTCRRQAEGMAQVVIRDHGIGIPAEKLPHIFEEFYRTREAVRHNKASTGLGLAIVRDVARMGGIQVRGG